jgi:hypothetical protein
VVATLLPNRRDPRDALDDVNRRLCERIADCAPIGERFATAGGDALLGDEVHPSPEGHAAIAAAFAEVLRARGIVPTPSPEQPGSSPQRSGGAADGEPSPAASPSPTRSRGAAAGGAASLG